MINMIINIGDAACAGVRSNRLREAALLTLLAALSMPAAAQLTATSVPSGYTASSLELGQPFGGALAFDSADPDLIYASVGSFGNMNVLRVDPTAGTTTTVAGPFGSIGGLALLGNGDLAVTENFTSDTIFRARDLNSDGDFLDEGELTELITPILTDGDFGGAQIAVAPAGSPSGIPGGSLVVQTADGETSSELLVVRDPETSTPAFQPAGGAYYDGFQYNGGVAFAPGGEIIVGESTLDFFTWVSSGRIVALVNTNGNERIDAGESNVLVEEALLQNGLTDLTISAGGRVFFGENGGNVRSFTLPGNLLTGSATPTVFAGTNGTYMSAVRLNRTDADFNSSNPSVKLYLGGYTPGFVQASNLLVIAPAAPSAVRDWAVYE